LEIEQKSARVQDPKAAWDRVLFLTLKYRQFPNYFQCPILNRILKFAALFKVRLMKLTQQRVPNVLMPGVNVIKLFFSSLIL